MSPTRRDALVRNREKSGALGGIRTPDTWFRRPVLYPLSYERLSLDDNRSQRRVTGSAPTARDPSPYAHMPARLLLFVRKSYGGVCTCLVRPV